MSVQSDDNKDHVRLNPFAFPADTDLRFVLLVVMIVAASTFAFNWMHLRLSGEQSRDRGVFQTQPTGWRRHGNRRRVGHGCVRDWAVLGYAGLETSA
jgi:hypothetical protein